jgi:hypothetical protein
MSRHGHTEISLTLPQISSDQAVPARCEKEEVMGEKRLKIRRLRSMLIYIYIYIYI